MYKKVFRIFVGGIIKVFCYLLNFVIFIVNICKWKIILWWFQEICLIWRKILGYICTVLNKFKFKDLIQIHLNVQDAQNMWNFHLGPTENVKKLKNHTSFVMTIYGCIPPSPSNPTHTLFLRHEVHIRSSQIDINVNNPKYLHNPDNQRSSQNFFLIYKCTTCVDSMQVHGKLHAS